MSRIIQPSSQIRLTNVAIVRLRRGGQRFEIACYPNKVRDWRAGFEKDVSEVLQSFRVFHNVNKGEFAKDMDLGAHFGTADIAKVSKIILDKGDMQLNTKERHLLRHNFVKDVCSQAAMRLVSIKTGLPVTTAMVESAVKRWHCVPKYKEGLTSKAACTRLVNRLISKMPDEIARALMRADIIYGREHKELVHCTLSKTFEAQILEDSELCEETSDSVQPRCKVSFRSPTAYYQKISDFVGNELGNEAELLVLEMLDKSGPSRYVEGDGNKTSLPLVEMKDSSCVSSDHSSDNDPEVLEEASSSSEEDTTGSAQISTLWNRDLQNRGRSIMSLMDFSTSEDEEGTSVSHQIESGQNKKVDSKSSTELTVDDIKALLEVPAKSSPEHFVMMDLAADNWEKKQRRKMLDMKEKKRERNRAEVEANAKAELKAKEMERREQLKREREARANQHIIDGGPGWCVVCQVNYAEELGQNLRQHFRMEWHTFNTKRRLRGKSPISQHDFDELARDIKDGFLAVTF